jgi:glycine cleavage system aminomethyltransferase T
MTDNIDSKGIARYPVGQWPVLDPDTNQVLIDDIGRRSYATSIAYGPSVGKNIALGYLPKAYAEQGRELLLEYFDEPFPIRVEAVGCEGLYDPDNLLPRE